MYSCTPERDGKSKETINKKPEIAEFLPACTLLVWMFLCR